MYYVEALKLLGLDKNCTIEDARVAYRRAAKINHPDLGGSEDQMKLINEAKDSVDSYIRIRDEEQARINKKIDEEIHRQSAKANTASSRASSAAGSAAGSYQNTYGNTWRHTSYYEQAANARQGYNRGPFQEEWEQFNSSFGKKVHTEQNYKKDTGYKRATRSSKLSDLEKLNKLLNSKINNLGLADILLKSVKVITSGTILGILWYNALQLIVNKPFKLYMALALLLIFVSTFVGNIFIKTLLDKNIHVNRIKVSIKNSSNGTFIVVKQNGVELGSFKIGESNFCDRGSSILNAWREAVIYGSGPFVINHSGKREMTVCGEQKTCKFLEFDSNCIIIPINRENYVVVYPGIFIYISANGIRVESMDTTSLKVEKVKDNVNFREVSFEHISGEKLVLYFTHSLELWEDLV